MVWNQPVLWNNGTKNVGSNIAVKKSLSKDF